MLVQVNIQDVHQKINLSLLNLHIKIIIDWGDVNQPIDEETFLNLYHKVLDYLDERNELYVFNGYAGSDKDTQLKLTVINELAWHNLFAHNMFIRPESKDEAIKIKPNFTIVSAPHFKGRPRH